MRRDETFSFKKTAKTIVSYRGFGLICSIIVILVVAAFVTPSIYSFPSFTTMLNDNAIFAILAVGLTFVLLTGGIDISVGSTLALSAVISTKLMSLNQGINPIVWILLSLLVGAACGLVNGFLIAKLKIIPLIATLATMYAYSGLAFLVTNGEWFTNGKGQYSESFLAISQTKFLGFSTMTWIASAILVLAGVFLAFTKPGRRLYAVGTSSESSEISGIKTDRVKIMAYILCGTLAGLCGVLFSSGQGVATSEVGKGYEMTAIAICVLGGISCSGGKGRIDGLILGILAMALLTKFISLIPGAALSTWADALKGLIIIFALVLNFINEKMKIKNDVLELARRIR